MATTQDDKPVNNGVNVEALFGAQAALTRGTGSGEVQVALDGRVDQRHAQPLHHRGLLRPGRRAEAQEASSPSTPTIPRSSPPRTRRPRRWRSSWPALASCLTAGVAAVAQARKVQLRSVSATLEAGMDVRGILGMDEDVRNGFDGIKVTYKIDADASPDDIKAIVAQSQKRSAVYDIITNPTNVTVEVA